MKLSQEIKFILAHETWLMHKPSHIYLILDAQICKWFDNFGDPWRDQRKTHSMRIVIMFVQLFHPEIIWMIGTKNAGIEKAVVPTYVFLYWPKLTE